MILDRIPNTTCVLEKGDGSSINNISVKIAGSDMFVLDTSVPIEVGDTLIRTLPSKIEQRLEIIDFDFNAKFHHIPEHYLIKFKIVSKQQNTNETSGNDNRTYHINNSNVIIDSDNSSINITKNEKLFNDLIDEASKLNTDNKDEIIKSIENMRDNVDTPLFSEKYKEFMAVSANTITVFTPYLGALAGLL